MIKMHIANFSEFRVLRASRHYTPDFGLAETYQLNYISTIRKSRI